MQKIFFSLTRLHVQEARNFFEICFKIKKKKLNGKLCIEIEKESERGFSDFTEKNEKKRKKKKG